MKKKVKYYGGDLEVNCKIFEENEMGISYFIINATAWDDEEGEDYDVASISMIAFPTFMSKKGFINSCDSESADVYHMALALCGNGVIEKENRKKFADKYLDFESNGDDFNELSCHYLKSIEIKNEKLAHPSTIAAIIIKGLNLYCKKYAHKSLFTMFSENNFVTSGGDLAPNMEAFEKKLNRYLEKMHTSELVKNKDNQTGIRAGRIESFSFLELESDPDREVFNILDEKLDLSTNLSPKSKSSNKKLVKNKEKNKI